MEEHDFSVAIIHHEGTGRSKSLGYLVSEPARAWEHEGETVHYKFGLKKYIPADLAIVHVDLSVTPESFLQFA